MIQGMPAINKSKTHCKRNHEYTETNTRYSGKNNNRHCKKCDAIWESNRSPRIRSQRSHHKIGEKVAAVLDPLRKGMEPPQECKKCRATGIHNFFHDFTDGMESYRCRQCGTEHYAYDAPPKSSKPGGKYSS